MNINRNFDHKKYAHSFVLTAHTPFGGEDHLLLIDEVFGEAEISTDRGSKKFTTYEVGDSSFSANFEINTPMTTSVSIQFSKVDDSEEFAGTVSIGKFFKTNLTAKRHQ